ncbi:hypothetical protein XENOCAPTIV_026557, partial [Xenoophorus captivus]
MQGEEEEADISLREGAGGREFCRHSGLINTHRLGVEPREALLFQGRMVVGAPPQQEYGRAPSQLMNPRTLLPHQAAPEPALRATSGLLLCPDGVLRVWGEAGGGDCCETTFIESPITTSSFSAAAPCSSKELLLFSDGKFVEFSGEEAKIPSLSYDIDDDDDDFQELE